jgi:uncharacterized membrane protein (UPF0136 family)
MFKNRALLGGFALGSLMIVLAYVVGSDWNAGARVATVVYAVLVTVFLLAQIIGFVASQVSYSQAVEEAKFEVLEVEGVGDRRRA